MLHKNQGNYHLLTDALESLYLQCANQHSGKNRNRKRNWNSNGFRVVQKIQLKKIHPAINGIPLALKFA